MARPQESLKVRRERHTSPISRPNPNWPRYHASMMASYIGIILSTIFQLKFDQSALEMHNFIRGNDKVPGAWAMFNGEVCMMLFEIIIIGYLIIVIVRDVNF